MKAYRGVDATGDTNTETGQFHNPIIFPSEK